MAVATETGLQILIRAGMTEEEIARAIGVTKQTIKRLLKGGSPSTATWQKINWEVDKRIDANAASAQ